MTSVRLSETSRQILRDLARSQGESMQAILEQALEDYRRKRFLEKANAAFMKLRENPDAWEEERQERKDWESTLEDDMEAS